MFELTFQPLALNVQAPPDADLQAGATPEISFQIVGGLILPIQGQTAAIPAVAFSFALNKDDSKRVGGELVKESDRLPVKLDVPIATNFADVTKAAEMDARLRGK